MSYKVANRGNKRAIANETFSVLPQKENGALARPCARNRHGSTHMRARARVRAVVSRTGKLLRLGRGELSGSAAGVCACACMRTWVRARVGHGAEPRALLRALSRGVNWKRRREMWRGYRGTCGIEDVKPREKALRESGVLPCTIGLSSIGTAAIGPTAYQAGCNWDET